MIIFTPDALKWLAPACPPLARQLVFPSTLSGLVLWLLANGVGAPVTLIAVTVITLCSVALSHPRELITATSIVLSMRRSTR